jgi:hypothetical protein
MTEAPDYIGRIAGARSWRIAPTVWARMGGLLWSHAILDPWPDGEEHEASCHTELGHRRPHEVPHEHCTCGILAFYDYETLVRSRFGPEDFRHVNGIVSAHGVTWFHDVGFRAQYARVEAIFDDGVSDAALPTPRSEIAEVYGVPIIGVADYEDFCDERGLIRIGPDDLE